ncbi:MAG: hypothetical protein CMO80_15490, partial [Verrucomicrobiales bacterium]|nr:hypothetical protein [Verrucomicrobiales bacterium]
NYFYKHLIEVYGERIKKRHAKVLSDADHHGSRVYSCAGGLKVLFDHDPRDSDGDGKSDWEEWLEGF